MSAPQSNPTTTIAAELHRLERAAAVTRNRNANAGLQLFRKHPEALQEIATASYHLYQAEKTLHKLAERLAEARE